MEHNSNKLIKGKAGGGFYGWWLLPVLCLVYSIPIGFALYGPPVINTFMADSLKWQRGEVNLGYSILAVTLGLGALLIPWLINRFGPRKTLIIGAIITATSSIFMATIGHVAVNLWGHVYPLTYWVICFFVGLGISWGTVIPIQTLVLLWFNAHRALAMGLVLGGGAIGGFIYPQITSACIVAFGGNWQAGWYAVALACFIGAGVAGVAVKDRPEDVGQYPDGVPPDQVREAVRQGQGLIIRTYRTSADWDFRDAVRTRSFWIAVVVIAVIFFMWQTVITQTPAHLRDRGFSPSDPQLIYQPAFIYGLVLACSMIGRLSISFLGERIEPRFLIAIAGASLIMGGILFWFASRDNLWATYLYPLFTGFGFGATYVCQPLIIGNYFGLRSFADLNRISHPIGSVFQSMAPAFAGFIYDINGNYGTAIVVACLAALVGTVLVFFCIPPKPHHRTST
jgi:MFS family permease